MPDTEFTIGAETYRASALSAFEQFHCLRRLGTIFGALATAMQAGASTGKDVDAIAAMEPIMSAMAALPEADANYVLETCLKHVVRRQPGRAWAKIYSAGAALMFSDIDMTAMLRITWAVLEGNLVSFFSGLVSPQPGTEARPTIQS